MSNNRSKIHVYFLINRPISEYLTHIVYSQATTAFGNDVTHSLGQTCVTYVAHSVGKFQNTMSLTSWTAAYLLLSVVL